MQIVLETRLEFVNACVELRPHIHRDVAAARGLRHPAHGNECARFIPGDRGGMADRVPPIVEGGSVRTYDAAAICRHNERYWAVSAGVQIRASGKWRRMSSQLQPMVRATS